MNRPRLSAFRSTIAATFVAGVLVPAVCGAAPPLLEVPDVNARVTFEGELAAPSPKPIEGEWLLQPLGGGEVVRHPVGAEPISLPLETRWEVSLVAQGFWAARQTLSLEKGAKEQSLRFKVWPLGAVEGTLQAPDRLQPLPKVLEVDVLLPKVVGEGAAPRGRTGCQIEPLASKPNQLPQLGYRCFLPAVKLDLSFQPQGYAPFYRRGLNVSASKPLTLDPVTLRVGGSIVGWVRTEGGPLLSQPALTLEPALGPIVGTAQEERSLRSTAQRASIGADGSFEFVALAPGAYVLRANLPGLSPYRSAPIEVFAGNQTLLQDTIVLRAPVDLEVEVKPAKDPRGEPWALLLIRNQDAGGKADFEGRSDREGVIAASALDAVAYTATLADSQGNEVWADPDFRVFGPGIEKKTIALEVWSTAGKVRYRGDPLQTSLWFGGRNGFEQVHTESDAEGEFAVSLPRLGTWVVDVQWRDEQVRTTRVTAKVRKRAEGEAEVVLEIPGARAFGRVFDSEGREIGANVQVHARNETSALRVSTNDKGQFTLDGLAAGSWSFQALRSGAGRTRTSETLVRAVSEDEELGPLTLTLGKGAPWKGRVMSPQGPIPGASVSLLGWRPQPGAGAQGRTDLDGTFEMELPTSVTAAIATIEAPGFGLRSVLWEPTLGPLRVFPDKGVLSVVFPETVVKGGTYLPVLTQDGIMIPLPSLAGWVRLHGETLLPLRKEVMIPSLAPALYRLCLETNVALAGQGFADPRRCAEGVLSAGGTLELDLSSVGSSEGVGKE